MNPPSPRVPVHVNVHGNLHAHVHGTRHVNVHGTQAFLARIIALLPPDVVVSPTSTVEDLVVALSSQVGCVVIADHADLGPGRPVSDAIAIASADALREGSGGAAPPPVLALGCADSVAVAAALAAGAALGLRADASPVEMASAVAAVARGRELERMVSLLRLDLEHQQLLLMKDDLTAAGNRRCCGPAPWPRPGTR